MKLGFALLAAGAAALNVMDDNLGAWEYDDCLDGWMQEDWDSDECGWWLSPDEDDDWADDEWVTCDEYYDECLSLDD